MNKIYPSLTTTGEEYTGNQQFKGSGIQRYCPLCGCHRTIGNGSIQRVMGIRQWTCQKHTQGGKK